MPLYEYQCKSCGHEKTVLAKMSAARACKCPACGSPRSFTKLISAASFQLKGNGWYATDFRDSGKKSAADEKNKESGNKEAATSGKDAKKQDGAGSDKTAKDAGKDSGGKSDNKTQVAQKKK